MIHMSRGGTGYNIVIGRLWVSVIYWRHVRRGWPPLHIEWEPRQ